MRFVILFLYIAAVVGCRYAPGYEGAACAASEPRCPAGLVCLEGRCLPPPEGISEEPDGGPVADEPPPPGDDPGPAEAQDAIVDSGEDGADGLPAADGSDADDGGEEPSDGRNCQASCPQGYYCDAQTNTCMPCNNREHCGNECISCAVDEQCLELSGAFCCRGRCSFERACREAPCATSGWICSLVFNPQEAWEWKAMGSGNYFCTLLEPDTPGHSVPVEDTFRCSENNSALLEFFCTYDGACTGGSCRPLAAAKKTHGCGPQFGCNPSLSRCRLHKKDGESCRFNYDCESFCCSRTAQAVCTTPVSPERRECKIATTEYVRYEDWWWRDFTFIAFNAENPHDISRWNRISGHHGTDCNNNIDCDSGNCNRGECEFNDCVGDKDIANIRKRYFCSANIGDGNTSTYTPTVTNNDPLPRDDDCPDRN